MNIITLDILGLAFMFWGVVIILYVYYYIRRQRTNIQSIIFVDLFYSVIYGFAPGLICFYAYNHGSKGNAMSYIDFSKQGIKYIGLFLICSIVVFGGIQFGYKFKVKQKSSIKNYISPRGIRISAFLLAVIGWCSLLLWTRVYGGPIGILPYANALRAGRDIGIYNPLSFFMKLCPFMQLAAYMFFSQYLNQNKRSDLFFFLISGIGSFLYILANSSRMHFVLFFVILFLLYASHHTVTKKTYVWFAVVSILGVSIMHVGENLMSFFQTNTSVTSGITFNIVEILREEFFFPMASFQTALSSINNGKVGVRFFVDIVNALFSWLPSRVKPSGLKTLEYVNTVLHSGTTLYGGLPTDFVTTCIYELNIVGLLIQPIVFGYLVKLFEKRVHPNFEDDYYKVLYVLGTFYFVKAVGYGDFSNIMSNIFFLVWGHLFTKLVCILVKGRSI